MSAASAPSKPKKTGLEYWMLQVLKEADKAGEGFAAETVHDLRVALRRCRSVAEVLLTADPYPDWKRMRREGKKVFSSLGELRDCQVLMEWVRHLGAPEDPVTQKLLAYTVKQEETLKAAASDALGRFDSKAWERWAASLPKRTQRFRLDGEIFRGVALERWAHAHELHRRAMRTRSKIGLHQLRIGVKKMRYVVENFLPSLHDEIGSELKDVQDLLGEVHDLDVLWDTAVRIHAFEAAEDRQRWRERIHAERARRVESYRGKATGEASLWTRWRSLLPDDRHAEHATYLRLRSWSAGLDPDFAHTRRVYKFAARLYEGLVEAGVLKHDPARRRHLLAAALMHDVGKRNKDGGHHRRTQRRIREFELPYGWSEQDRELVALVARLHRGDWEKIPPKERGGVHGPLFKEAMKLGGVLRLANALDHDHDGVVQEITISYDNRGVLVHANGLRDGSDLAERIAAARHLLEVSCDCLVLVKGRPGRVEAPSRLRSMTRN